MQQRINLDYHSLRRWWEDPARGERDHIGYGRKDTPTTVRQDGDSFIIRYLGHDMCRVLPGNVVEFLSPADTMGTHSRLWRCVYDNLPKKEGEKHQFHFWSWRNYTRDFNLVVSDSRVQLKIPADTWERTINLFFPAQASWRSDYRPTMVDLYLSIGCRIGDPRAAEVWAKRLEARGFPSMAAGIRRYKGRRYAWGRYFRILSRAYKALQELPYATDKQMAPGPLEPNPKYKGESWVDQMVPGPSLADQGITSGLWLADEYAHGGPLFGIGDLVRPLSMWDIITQGVNPKEGETAIIEGRSYKVVNGATYHDKLKGNWRFRGGINPKRLKVHSHSTNA